MANPQRPVVPRKPARKPAPVRSTTHKTKAPNAKATTAKATTGKATKTKATKTAAPTMSALKAAASKSASSLRHKRPSEPNATATHTSSRSGPLTRPASATAPPAHQPLNRAATNPTPWERVSTTGGNVTTRLQERLRERRAARTRLTALTWTKRIAIGGGVLALGWVALLSPVFALDAQSAQVTGYGSVVSQDEVAQVLAAHDGTSLVRLDTGAVTEQLQQLVGVREATITRVWPSGLRVELSSSEPVAAIPQGDGEFALVDDLGEHVASATTAPEHLPVITVPVAAGQTRILEGVLGVIHEIPVALRDRVEGIEAQTEDSIHFVLRDGPRVEWGSGEQSVLKAEVLQALLDSPQAAGVDVIDVSAPSLPITREE